VRVACADATLGRDERPRARRRSRAAEVERCLAQGGLDGENVGAALDQQHGEVVEASGERAR
jgi:hypothetical protein